MFKDSKVKLETHGERSFALLEDLVYEGKAGTFTIPAGFVTDFASVPPQVSWLIPSYGKYTLAAIVHDYLCVELGNSYRNRYTDPTWQADWIYPPTPANSRDTDGIFRRIMRELEVPFLRRWVMWTGVRWGALANPARRKGVAKDLPLMLLWSLLSAPVVIPATIVVGLGLLVDKVFEMAVGRFIK